jgi:hypothetical protein
VPFRIAAIAPNVHMPSKSKGSRSKPELTFDGACALMERILGGAIRREILGEVARSKNFDKALLRLRESLRSHRFGTGSGQVSLDRMVNRFDSRTRQDGFHVLHDWDGKADRFNEESIPVDVLNFTMRSEVAEPHREKALAILLDYYFMYVLALMSLRVWDEPDASDHLDRLTDLVHELQGPEGSGQKLADNAETLLFIGTSHFEPDAGAYDRMLEKVRSLNEPHRRNAALVHAAILASHLRFGFEATYGRDVIAMREDNTPDYPWLSFALSTLMNAYARMHDEGVQGIERQRVVESLLNGLTADPRAFVGGNPPAALAAHEGERSRFRELFLRYRPDLLREFEDHRPSDQAYSPLSFFFNFSHNTLKAIVVDALLRGETWSVTLNDLLTGIPGGEPMGALRETLARTIMGHARSSPDTIRGRLVPAIIYDPEAGLRAFDTTLQRISE